MSTDSWHVYTRERHFVPDEVSVYVCEQHRPVGLEVPRAFWNDVVGRGPFQPGAARVRRAPRGSPPFISALANCPIILDGRWPIVSAEHQLSNFTRHTTRPRWPALRLEKLQLGDSTRIHPIPFPSADYICPLSFVSYVDVPCDFSSVLGLEKNSKFEEILEIVLSAIIYSVWLVKFSEKEKFWREICS